MKRICIIWLSITLIFSSAFLIIDISEDTEGKIVVQDGVNYVPHAPIRINGNGDFPAIATSGDGSPGTPWIIEGWEINGTGLGYCIFVGNTTDYFVVRDCYLHEASGGTSYYNYDSGVILANARNGLISNNDALFNELHGIFLWNYSNNNTIDLNDASNNMYGVSLDNSIDNTIINNSLSDNWDGIYFYQSNDNSIINNTAINNQVGFYIFESDKNMIVNNTNPANLRTGISISRSNSNYLSNNTLSNNLIGISLANSINNILENNMMSNDGLSIDGSLLEHWNTHTIAATNTINGKPIYYLTNQTSGTVAIGAGQIILANCTNVVINNHSISNTCIGINLGFSSDNTITDNNGMLNNYHGFSFSYSHNNDILNNVGHINGYYGLKLAYSNDNLLHNNTFSSNTNYGILLLSSQSNTISNNIFHNNDVGLYCFFMSDSNFLYHNNLIDNTIQANDDGSNYWYNGYPSGGNYWSDYTGVELYSGPNQDQPGSDGIGDSPYINIQGGSNVDEYPLMTSFEYTEFNISLQQGWNLISLPLRQLDWSIDSVLESIDGSWDCLQTFNVSSATWNSNNTYRPDVLNDLKEMNHFNSYWINITMPVTLTVKGDKFNSDLNIPLKAGWNLVGYPSLGEKSITDALVGTGYDRLVEGFNASAPYRISQLSDSYMMKPGEGYWVHVPADTNWIVEGIPANPQIAVHDITFSKAQPEKGELITIGAVIRNYASFGIVDVKFYDGDESSENLIGTDIIVVPAIGQFISQIEWIATPGGFHTILVTALLNETWASQQGVVDLFPLDNYLDKPLFVFPNILLVDDDNQPNDQSSGDTSSFMRASLEATDFDYDFTIVSAGGNGPGYDYGDYHMENYDIVIWMTGYETFFTLTLTDIGELEKFLDGGGSLWFISQGFWDEALGDPDLTAFAENYLHTPTMPPALNPGLPNQLYGNYSHPVTYTFTDDPLNTMDRLPGMIYERSYWWDVGSVPIGSMGLNSSNQCYAVSYDSDDDVANPVKGSRIFVQTWEYSRIEDTATQAQFTCKVLHWLGNITMKFGRDFAISQQDIIPKTVTISETVNITAIIRNNGFANEIDVEAMLIHNGLPEATSYTLIPLIGGNGGEWEASFIWTADTVGTHEFKWMVDPNDLFSETNEFNNQISIYLNNITVEVLP